MQPDYASIGERVKKQYPQYAQMDSATLGQKYSAKYGNADPTQIKPVTPQTNVSSIYQDQAQPAAPQDPNQVATPDYAAIRLHKANDLKDDLTTSGGKHQVAINSYYDSLLPTAGEQAQIDKKDAEKQKMSDAYTTTKGSIQNLLDTYGSLSGDQKGGPVRGFLSDLNPYTEGHEYESQRKALAAGLKDVAGAGAGSGVRVTQAELNAWGNLVPSVHKTDAQNKIDIISLNKQLVNKFGQGLDQEYLQKFGVSSDGKAAPEQDGALSRIFKGGINDVKDIASGLYHLPGAIANDPVAVGKGAVKGTIDEYKDLLTNPVNHVQDHPVNTILDVLPFIKPLQEAGIAGKAANVASKVGEVADGSNALSKAGEISNKIGSNLKQGVRQIDVPPSIYGASKEAAINSTLDKLGITGSAADQYAKLQPAMDQLSDQIHNSLTTNPKMVPMSTVQNDFLTNLKDQLRSKNLSADSAKKEISGYMNDLYTGEGGNPVPESIPTTDLFDLKKKVNQDYQSVAKKIQNGSTLNDREKVIAAARQTLDDIISNEHPDVKEATVMQSHLYDAAESLHKSRNVKSSLQGLGVKIPLPSGTLQKGQDFLGNILQRPSSGE